MYDPVPAPIVRAEVCPYCPSCDEPMHPVGSRQDRELRVSRYACLECGHRVEVARQEEDRPLGAPTDALAGSKEKLAEMARRAANGQQLFHPEDNKQRARGADGRTGGGSDPKVRAAARELPEGVSYDRRLKLYRARAVIGGVRRHLGCFPTVALAAAALERARRGG